MKIMMSKHESLECSGGARWGGLALVLACGVAQIGCGNASKKEIGGSASGQAAGRKGQAEGSASAQATRTDNGVALDTSASGSAKR